ncbi:MAG: tRNA guanosine(15) transglycosylase TgtA [Candidatus Methanomethylicota archaeon]|nr:MAG: tRNA guanosine(15) transglycosylase TgtA [Candidatus Verstraetearchaeota archaeon]
MSFEIIDRDLAGRIGKLKTKSGNIETPAFFPVVNPRENIIACHEISEKFKIKNIITNAYLIKRQSEKQRLELKDVHELLNFKDIIMTDSGAYQILMYGEIKLEAEEVVELQEKLNSDIAVILDVPTPRNATRKIAERTVEMTIRNAEISIKKIKDHKIIWVGPVQGGRYLKLIEYCARRIGEMPFQIHGIGGPTQYMEKYEFEELVDIIVTAKKNLPLQRPVHLFGAGHPIILPLLVALGCDTFDSASYALYAKDDRYMTPHGTIKLSRLEYLPCNCDICRKYDASELKEMEKTERLRLLAEHNLWIIIEEIKRIKQAIKEGTLWELLEVKGKTHPQMYKAVKRLEKYREYLEEFDPITKGEIRGIFYTTSEGLIRPEVTRHIKKLRRNVRFKGKEILLLLPEQNVKPHHKSMFLSRLLEKLKLKMDRRIEKLHFCIYTVPFGLIPIELDEIYPLSQYENAKEVDACSEKVILEAVEALTEKNNYKRAIIVCDQKLMSTQTLRELRKILKKRGISVEIFKYKGEMDVEKLIKEQTLYYM